MNAKRNSRLLPALVLGIFSVLGLGTFVAEKVAHAQQGYNLSTVGGSVSISGATPAVLVSGVAGQKIYVVSMRLATVGTGGLVQLYNGTANPTTTGLTFANGNPFAAYVPASTSVNNNVFIGPEILPQQGGGMLITSSGLPLCAQLNGAILVYEVQYYVQ
jgi:hypothetical protein